MELTVELQLELELVGVHHTPTQTNLLALLVRFAKPLSTLQQQPD